jgi:hypothetical protein
MKDHKLLTTAIFTPKKYCSSVLQKSHNVINDLIQVIVLKFVAEFLGSPVLGDRNFGFTKQLYSQEPFWK